MAASYNSPCAACKFLRRKCSSSCIFAPYFPPEDPQKFANIHKIFGASNVAKALNDLPVHQRDDAVCSLAYEAEARVLDPVYGCVGAISYLQRQVQRLQNELDAANADLLRFSSSEHHHQAASADTTAAATMVLAAESTAFAPTSSFAPPPAELNYQGGGGFFDAGVFPYDFVLWNDGSGSTDNNVDYTRGGK